jgi:hypothetical protein
MQVQYIGNKPRKVDNVADTGLVWDGHGDVQDVPDAAAAKMLRHPDVWALPAVDHAPEPEKDPEKEQQGLDSKPDFKLAGPDDTVIDLAEMDDKAVKAFAAEHKLDVDLRKKGDALRGAVMAAIDAAAAKQEG